MFEKIVLRRSEDGTQPTLGEIAEAMLFYQHVHLILDRAAVLMLGKKLGVESLLSLLQRGGVTATYCRDELVTQTTRSAGLEHHLFSAIELVGKDGSDQKYSVLNVVAESIKASGSYSSRKARKLAERFLEVAPTRVLAGKDFLGARKISLIEAATADVMDSSYAVEAISRILYFTPGFEGFRNTLSWDVQSTYRGFTVFSNLDLIAINEARARMVPPLGPLAMAYFVNEILAARSDMLLAAHYGSDFKTSLTGSSLIAVKYQELLQRSAMHATEREQFQKVVVDEGRTLAEAINSGDKSFEDFLRLLDKSQKFKNWTSDIHPDESMVRAYFEEKTREGWVGSLPMKILRFVVGGALDGGTGVAYGLADSFLLEKLVKGWRPSHFVDDRLKPFVKR